MTATNYLAGRHGRARARACAWRIENGRYARHKSTSGTILVDDQKAGGCTSRGKPLFANSRTEESTVFSVVSRYARARAEFPLPARGAYAYKRGCRCQIPLWWGSRAHNGPLRVHKGNNTARICISERTSPSALGDDAVTNEIIRIRIEASPI